jgi:hypothetical protein
MPAVLARPRVSEPRASHLRKAERVAKFATGKQPGIRGDHQSAKLERQPAIKIEPESLAIGFTRRVLHDSRLQSILTY